MAPSDNAGANKENLFNTNTSSRNADGHDGAFAKKNNLNNARINESDSSESRCGGLETSDGNLPSFREVGIFTIIQVNANG